MKKGFVLALLISLISVAIIFSISSVAQATLFDRGNGLIYDDYLDITLMQEINSSWLLNAPGNWGNGIISWPGAMAWVAGGITYQGISGWRMLSIENPDGSQCVGYDCPLSEFGHIWHNELGNKNKTLTEMGPFTLYGGVSAIWAGTPDQGWPDDPPFYPYPFFNFANGYQGFADCHIAWLAVDGDVTIVPEPSTVILLGAGLLGLVAFRRKKLVIK
ncbi:MAG TPA: PEP-CTERM sorting domain-containing protein [Nitrospirae bacterium]|nr:PEP-CTERM sorting domain-containing protein [Nitrospirota bacterium]